MSDGTIAERLHAVSTELRRPATYGGGRDATSARDDLATAASAHRTARELLKPLLAELPRRLDDNVREVTSLLDEAALAEEAAALKLRAMYAAAGVLLGGAPKAGS